MKGLRLNRWARRGLVVLGSVALVVMLLGLMIYWWPIRTGSLEHGSGANDTYVQATATFANINSREAADRGLLADCHSILLTHGVRTKNAVVMFHGYHNCPSQFRDLAKTFYNAGYNVYVPLAPHQGRMKAADARISAQEVVDYADKAVTLGSGLGEVVGEVGLSAGANVATWAAFYRQDVVRKVLLLSPFYMPSTTQLPMWERKPFLVLYGFRILPDRFDPNGLSYQGLAQYVQVAQNYPARLNTPIPTAVVLSAGDQVIDKGLAHEVAKRLNTDPLIWVPPKAWGLGHDIVNDTGSDTNGHASVLYPGYLRLYEGQSAN